MSMQWPDEEILLYLEIATTTASGTPAAVVNGVRMNRCGYFNRILTRNIPLVRDSPRSLKDHASSPLTLSIVEMERSTRNSYSGRRRNLVNPGVSEAGLMRAARAALGISNFLTQKYLPATPPTLFIRTRLDLLS